MFSRSPSRAVWMAASAIVLAICVAPFALAAGERTPVKGGARNPSSNGSIAYTKETQIIANNSTYGTRQSNKSSNGGGAIYGCRSGEGGSPKGNNPCIRAANIAKGFAFEFDSRGTQGGTITVGNGGDTTVPFTTNATGVATGLNADRVDSKSASDIVKDAQALNQFASVSSTGTLSGGRGATAATRTAAGTYTVTFAGDVSKCGYSATEIGSTAAGAASVDTIANQPTQLSVVTRDNTGAIADHQFHLVVIC